MYYFIDLCCGFGSLTKAFERTGAFKCVGAADADDNMKNHYNFLFNRKPLGDIREESVQQVIFDTPYDVLCAGIGRMSDEIFYTILEIIEHDEPKAFVIEMDNTVMAKSLCKTVAHFCDKYGYIFCGYNNTIESITLNLMDFGVPEFCEKIYCVCIKEEWARCKDRDFLQLNKKHDYECYKYKTYDPEKNIEQLRGTDWGFGGNFNFLTGTPDNHKKLIIEESTPIPVACNVALCLMGWLE